MCVLLSAVQQIVLIAADCIDRNGMERSEVVDSRDKVGEGVMEHDVRVAGGTADIETGQLLVIQGVKGGMDQTSGGCSLC